MAEPSGASIARKAFRRPFEDIGWKPRAAGWFTKTLSDGWTGVVAVTHSSTGFPAVVDVNLRVDLRHDATEDAVSAYSALKTDYRTRTILRQLHQFCPNHQLPERRVTADTADAVASSMVSVFVEYAMPWMVGVAESPQIALDATARNIGGSTPNLVRYVLLGEALGGEIEKHNRLLRAGDYITNSRLGGTRETIVHAFQDLAHGTGILLPESAHLERSANEIEIEMYPPIMAAAEVIAVYLAEYGEDQASTWVLNCSDDELMRVVTVAGWLIHNGPGTKAGSMIFAKALALASVYVHEGTPRNLRRSRRKTIGRLPVEIQLRYPSPASYPGAAQTYPVGPDARAFWSNP